MLDETQEFILKVIDAPSWDRARWLGTAFLWFENEPPDLPFIFEDEGAARDIFAGLRGLVSEEDEEELLRVCIIEGSFGGNENAYGVHLGANFANVTRHFGRSAEEVSGERFVLKSRFLRMNPQTLEPLHEFRRRFERLGRYRIIPLIHKDGETKPLDELGIVKRELFFRDQSSITPNDEDAIALTKNSPPN